MNFASQRALSWATSLGHQRLFEEAYQRIATGKGDSVLYLGREEESPEAPLVELLLSNEVRGDLVSAVLTAAQKISGEIFASISNYAQTNYDGFVRWCNLIDRSAHPDLTLLAVGVFTTAIAAGLGESVLAPLCRAVRDYKLNEGDVPTWEKLLGYPGCSAFAFRAILKICPNHHRVGVYLYKIWKNVVTENWPVAAPLLTLEAAKKQGGVHRLVDAFAAEGRLDVELHNLILANIPNVGLLNELKTRLIVPARESTSCSLAGGIWASSWDDAPEKPSSMESIGGIVDNFWEYNEFSPSDVLRSGSEIIEDFLKKYRCNTGRIIDSAGTHKYIKKFFIILNDRNVAESASRPLKALK